MAETTKPAKQRPYVLPDSKLQQREQVFLIYRDMGPARSIARLERLLRDQHPELHVARPSLEKWSVQHGWAARVQAHDAAAGTAAIDRPQKIVEDDPIEALVKLANQTLARALGATPAVTRPNEVKSLIDSATNALKLAEQIKASQTTKSTAAEVAQEMRRVLALIDERRRADVREAAIALRQAKGFDVSVFNEPEEREEKSNR